MNKLKLLMILALIHSFPLLAQPISKGRNFQSKILDMRVQEILKFRAEGLYLCMKQKKGYSLSEYKSFKSELNSLIKTKYENNLEKVKNSLDLLTLTQSHKFCSREIKEADLKLRKIQTKRFEIPKQAALGMCSLAIPGTNHRCINKAADIIKKLDPFCVTQNHEDIFGVKDPNPCMAGDRFLASRLRVKNDPNQEQITTFLNTLEQTIELSDSEKRIDLWKVFLRNNSDDTQSREKFMALLGFLYYSLGSAGGYLDGIADFYWRSSFNENNDSEAVFGELFSLRQQVDRYRYLINKKAKEKDLKIAFKHVLMRDMNRHDFMAMFLSCHFRSDGKMTARILPNILGIGYESLDFVSHIKQEVPVKKSFENFQRDTSRYSKGSSIGAGFCEFKF